MDQKIKFTKMHGLGNNYIYLDLVSEEMALPALNELAIRLSNQNTGIGSDGMILILPSAVADIRMRVFNKDGSEAKNCGNGLRCVAKYAYDNGLVTSKTFTIETLGGNVKAEIVEAGAVSQVTIDMGVPRLERGTIPMAGDLQDQPVINETISLEGEEYRVTGVSMGNPHGIFFVDDIFSSPIQQLGPLLADGHPYFPEGVNVGFVEKITNQEFQYRVWERGSGITQACGTGACAAAVAAVLTEQAKKGEAITIHLAGGDLVITWDDATNHVLMTGPAVVSCEGYYYDAV